MGFISRFRRVPLVVVGAALLTAVAAPSLDTVGPVASELSATAEVHPVEQAAGGGPITSVAVPAPRLEAATGVGSVAYSAGPITPPDVAARPTGNVGVTTVEAFYDVIAGDRASIIAAMHRHGPRDAHGAWAGSLSWTFNWSYQPLSDGGACRVYSAAIDLHLAYTLPRLVPEVEPSLVDRDAWERFQVGLRRHEDGHAALAVEAANAVVRDIEAAQPARSCSELRTAVEAIVQASLDRHDRAQVAYDERTGHGITQGATFSYSDTEPACPWCDDLDAPI